MMKTICSQLKKVGILVALLLCCNKMSARAEGEDTLKVAFYPLEGFFEYDAEGKETGYGVEVLNRISEYSGLKFSYVKAESWEDTKKMLLSGEADIRMPGSLPTHPSKELVYSEESVMDTFRAVMTLKSRTDLYYKDYENFPEMTFAATQSFLSNTDIEGYLEEVGITDENLIIYEEYDECREALEDGKADAVISNIMDLNDDMKILARFHPISNYISMRIDDVRIQQINNTLNDLKIEDPGFLTNLYRKYFPERMSSPLTREEASLVAKAGVITVGQLAGRKPLSYVDEESGDVEGMFVDLCELLAEKSGLQFQYEMIPAGTRAVDWLDGKEHAIVAGVMFSSLSYPSEELLHTTTAFPASVVVVGRKGETFNNDGKWTIAMPIGYIGGQSYIEANYPNATVHIYNGNEECLDAINSGRADVLLQDLYVVREALQSPRYDNLEIFPAYQIDENMKLVMLNTGNEKLISVLNKAIESITQEELDDIIVRHTIAKTYKLTWKDTFYKYRIPILIITTLVLIAFGLLLRINVIRRKNELAITEKNDALAEANQQINLASKSKSDFLARMSHEIRTPMNAIIGMTTLARDHMEKPKEIEEDLNKIELSSKVLLSIINDVLDMSAIESGKIKIAHEPFNFKMTVQSLITVYHTQCELKHIVFKEPDIEEIDEFLIGDQLRLNQILLNLLSNAVKFTKEGSVSLEISSLSLDASKINLRFVVSDTGCGMNEEMLARIWNPFEQESAKTARDYGGSGLGLSIVKNLLALMGGNVTVSSEPMVGTTFTVDIPFDRYDEKQPQVTAEGKEIRNQQSDIVLSGKHVLLAEDNEMNRFVGTGLLKKLGVSCETAENGKLAVERFLKSAPGEFDAILMDVQMPVMDGYEATRLIRASNHPKANQIAILSMTADAFHEEIIREQECGMDDHISKPIDINVLKNVLERAIQKEESKGIE